MVLACFSFETELLPFEGGGYREMRDGELSWVMKWKANFPRNHICKNRRVPLLASVLHIKSFKPGPYLDNSIQGPGSKGFRVRPAGLQGPLCWETQLDNVFLKKYLVGGRGKRRRRLPPNVNGRESNPESAVTHLPFGRRRGRARAPRLSPA